MLHDQTVQFHVKIDKHEMVRNEKVRAQRVPAGTGTKFVAKLVQPQIQVHQACQVLPSQLRAINKYII